MVQVLVCSEFDMVQDASDLSDLTRSDHLQIDSSDIRTDNVQQDAWDENGSQSQSHSNPAPEHVPTDMKVEEHESEDDGPPPGWNLKCQLEPNSQMICPTTPPSDSKNEEDKEETPHNEGSPPGWRSTPQQQSHVHSTLPSPNVHSDF